MTPKEFTDILEIKKGYPYSTEDGKIIVHYNGHVDLSSLKSIPENVVFSNGWSLFLNSLEDIPRGTQFKNGEAIYLNSITSIPSWVEFNNGASVYLKSIIGTGGFPSWPGNIDNIASNRLLNHMISKGMFI